MNIKSSEQKADRLYAESQISRLIYDYAYHLDMNHTAELAGLFVEDCVVVYGPNFGAEGRAAYAKTLEGVGSYFVATSHNVSNIVIDFVSEDEAKVRTILYAWHRYTRERPDSHVWGQYHDEVVRVDGEWRFKRRELRTTGAKDFHVKETMPIGRRA